MDRKRLLELLAYAKVCFEHYTNPFETIHLVKKKVRSDECIDMSHLIGELIEDYYLDCIDGREAMEKAEKEFAETQKELIGRYG